MNLNELVYRLENSMGIDYDLLSQAANKLRQQQTMIDEYIKATDYWMKLCQEANANYTPQIKELSDEELNKAFDYYCETDEGVLRFNY
jgi:rubrerythrin